MVSLVWLAKVAMRVHEEQRDLYRLDLMSGTIAEE